MGVHFLCMNFFFFLGGGEGEFFFLRNQYKFRGVIYFVALLKK